MRIKTINLLSQGAASNAAFAAAQALTANTAMTLLGAASSISPAREVTFTSTGDTSNVTLTVTGRDRRGNIFVERIRGPNANTVRTLSVFSELISVVPNITDTDTVSIGYPARVCGPWLHNNTLLEGGDIPTARVQALPPDLGGTFAAGIIELTNENVMNIPGDGAYPETTTISLGSAGATGEPRAAFFRIVNTSTTSGAQLKCAVVKPSF